MQSFLRTNWPRQIAQMGSVLCALSLAAGCAKNSARAIFLDKRDNIGSFCVNAVSNQMTADIFVPAGTMWQNLVLVIDGSSLDNEEQVRTIARSMQHLRLGMRLYSDGKSEDLFRAELVARTNLCGVGSWHAPRMCYVVEVEPFPHQVSHRESPLEVYPSGRNAPPFRDGWLVSPARMKLNMSVLNPIALTNQVQVWLHCYLGGQVRDVQQDGVDRTSKDLTHGPLGPDLHKRQMK
jgi:hypothetical protein